MILIDGDVSIWSKLFAKIFEIVSLFVVTVDSILGGPPFRFVAEIEPFDVVVVTVFVRPCKRTDSVGIL